MKNREAKRERDSKRESEQSVGMQAGEECGFYGNAGKAELWVSVPALHCTGPRLSATSLSLSLSSLPHYIFLHTHPSSLLFSSSLSHTHSQQALNHTRINLYCHCICMQISLYKHTDSMCLKPVSLSVSPLSVPPDPHSSTHPLR